MKKWSLHLKKTVFLGQELYCCHLKIAKILEKKSLGQYCNIHIFPSFLGSLLKQCIIFEISCSSPSPNPMQSWNSEKILDTRVQHCLWGEGRVWTCMTWKTPQKRKSVPRLLSMIVGTVCDNPANKFHLKRPYVTHSEFSLNRRA